MITPRQCRAARGLLGYTQADLAKEAGMSKTGLNNFESGKSSMKISTQKSLKSALERAGVDFTKGEGVKLRTNDATVFYGDNAQQDLWDHIVETFDGKGGDVVMTHVTNDMIPPMDVFKKHNISMRFLVTKGQDIAWASQSDFKLIPEDSFNYANSKFIYGNHVAIQMWQDNTIALITSEKAAESERERFEEIWAKASSSKKSHAA